MGNQTTVMVMKVNNMTTKDTEYKIFTGVHPTIYLLVVTTKNTINESIDPTNTNNRGFIKDKNMNEEDDTIEVNQTKILGNKQINDWNMENKNDNK